MPAVTEPSHAMTIDSCPARTSAASSCVNTCSAPPTASGPTGANGYAMLRMRRDIILDLRGRFARELTPAGTRHSPVMALVIQPARVRRRSELITRRETEPFGPDRKIGQHGP